MIFNQENCNKMPSNGPESFTYTGMGTVPKNVVSVVFAPTVTEVGDCAFAECKLLTNVALNEGLKKIGKEAFKYGVSLKSIQLPSTVSEVCYYAFYCCGDLKNVVLNEGLRKIGDYTFLACYSLESISIPHTVIDIGECIFEECCSLKDVALSVRLQKIKRRAFYNCKSLDRIELPPSVIEIGCDAFVGCRALKNFTLNEGLRLIGKHSFQNCPLESIKLPSTVIEICDFAFASCHELTNAMLNEGLQKIGEFAFLLCALKSIKFPSTVTEIGQHAFASCYHLKDVALNEGLQKIGTFPFYSCSCLESCKVPIVSMRLEAISSKWYPTKIVDEIRNAYGMAIVEGEILISGTILEGGKSWTMYRESLDRILDFLTYYELKEAATAVELALWKARIKGEDMANESFREMCRIGVPGPVKNAILQFISYKQICSDSNSALSGWDSDSTTVTLPTGD
mmetsp:Transcript_28432/g.60033  ORF Transcript_28432/g.60033 Transcript_28432/m.60033 type:complete len:454 (+) Transcript_28432:82-1443(+)